MVVIIDNYDSFTYNLARYFEELNQVVKVVKNDELTINQLESLGLSHLVISPGPCTPDQTGICLEAIKHFCNKVPILGVCLGHQAIAQVFGGKVVNAKNVLHGKTSSVQVESKSSRLFAGCSESFTVTRYHSLLIDFDTIPEGFDVTATSMVDNIKEVMAIENYTLRTYGIQFHPESLLTEFGHKILNNFLIKG